MVLFRGMSREGECFLSWNEVRPKYNCVWPRRASSPVQNIEMMVGGAKDLELVSSLGWDPRPAVVTVTGQASNRIYCTHVHSSRRKSNPSFLYI